MQKGFIINNISNLYQVQIGNDIVECIPRGKIKKEELSPVVGDYVEIEKVENENKGIIHSILPRKMYSKRPKLANLTQIVLVISLKDPKPDLLLLDKQLIYSEYLNINPIICINKIDIGDKQLLKEIHEIYENIGYTVIETIAKQKIGIDELRKLLNNNITCFSGNSGVGKSTLINSLFGENKTEEGIISKKNKKGKNTTTDVKLYKIDNGYIADTPGFSTFSIEEVESEDLDKYFREFKNYLSECEYDDCEHVKEKKCGIRKALQDNKINLGRYERYCKIREQLKEREEHKW